MPEHRPHDRAALAHERATDAPAENAPHQNGAAEPGSGSSLGPGSPLREAARIAERYIAEHEGAAPKPPRPAGRAAAELPLDLPRSGLGESEALRRLESLVMATPTTSGPRFMNQLFGGREPLAATAEALTAVLNNSMYTYKAAGPQVLAERTVLERMLELSGFAGGDGLFAPGGSMSNLAAMLIARNERVPGAREHGFDGRRRTVYTSAERHYSLAKNCAMIGVGRENLRSVETDRDGRMKPEALRAAIERDTAAGLEPMMIVATSGTTVIGAFDPLGPLADARDDYGLWLHVDGAFGGTALLHPATRGLLDGLDRADSFTWDAHKAMGVPLTCSVALTRRPGLTQAHFDEHADYLFQDDAGHDDPWLNPGTRSLQCGRRNDALKLWALWQAMGDNGFEHRVGRILGLTRHAAGRVEAEPDLDLTLEPPWVNLCFEVRGRCSEAICSILNDSGRLKVGYGTVRGRRVIRMVFTNPALTADSVDRALDDVLDAARQAPASDNSVPGRGEAAGAEAAGGGRA